MDDKELSEIVVRLDKEVAREGAAIMFMQYSGGSVEERVIANRAGYLRFGIEFLKAALAPCTDEEPFAIDVDLGYLLDSSDINFGRFERRELFDSLNLNESPTKTLRDKITDVGCSVIWFSSIGFAFIGFITVVRWIFWMCTSYMGR